MAELKKPVGKDAAANDDTNKPGETERADVKGAELFLDGACFDTTRLVGDLADFLLKDLRVTQELKSWAKMSEKQQNALIDRAEKQAKAIIAGAVRSLASHGLDHMEGLLEDKGSFGDGFFKLSIKVPMNAHNMLLLAKHDGEVQVVFSSPQKFHSTMMVRSMPDAPVHPVIDAADKANGVAGEAEAGGAKGKTKPPKDKPEDAAATPAAAPST